MNKKSVLPKILLIIGILVVVVAVYYFLNKSASNTSVPEIAEVTTQPTTVPAAPIISSISAKSVSVGNSSFSITASNLDSVDVSGASADKRWFSRSHIFVRLISESGQTGILWEGGSQGGNTVNGDQIAIPAVPQQICVVPEVGAGPCPADKEMTITPGNYSLNIIVDGRGPSNNVPLTITP